MLLTLAQCVKVEDCGVGIGWLLALRQCRGAWSSSLTWGVSWRGVTPHCTVHRSDGLVHPEDPELDILHRHHHHHPLSTTSSGPNISH